MESNIRTPVTLIELPPKSVFMAAVITGVILASAYYFGKRVQKYETAARTKR